MERSRPQGHGQLEPHNRQLGPPPASKLAHRSSRAARKAAVNYSDDKYDKMMKDAIRAGKSWDDDNGSAAPARAKGGSGGGAAPPSREGSLPAGDTGAGRRGRSRGRCVGGVVCGPCCRSLCCLLPLRLPCDVTGHAHTCLPLLVMQLAAHETETAVTPWCDRLA